MKKLLFLALVSCTLLSGCYNQQENKDEGNPSNAEGSLSGNEVEKSNEDTLVSNAQNPTSNEMPETSTTEPTKQTYISENEAKTIAYNHASVLESEVTFVKVDFDYEKGVAEYEVDFYVGTTEYDYDINAVTGEVIAYGIDLKNQSSNLNTDSTYITDETAKTIALQHAGVLASEASSVKVEFDFDKGIAEYEVQFRVGKTEYEYEINATTGEIISYEFDND